MATGRDGNAMDDEKTDRINAEARTVPLAELAANLTSPTKMG